jgi:hypothetical protein
MAMCFCIKRTSILSFASDIKSHTNGIIQWKIIKAQQHLSLICNYATLKIKTKLELDLYIGMAK